MKSLTRLFGLIALVAASVLPAQEYQFKFNYQESSQNSAEPKPIVRNGGMVTVNGVKMKGYNTIFNDPRKTGPQTQYDKALKVKIKSEYLKHFELYAMPNGVVFVPKNWQLVQGSIANNGGISYIFVPPNGDDGYLSFQHNGNCVSCAMESASLFFAQAVKDAQEHDFNFYTSSNLPLTIVKIKQNLVSYYTESSYLRLDGMAFYDPNAIIPFWKAEISLPPKLRHLANPLLNQFITKYDSTERG